MSHLDAVFTGADVLRPGGMRQDSFAMSGGVFSEHAERRIDLTGYRVLPGIVDIHGDGFERHLAPRRGVMKDFGEGLRAVDAELAANGITTAMLAQFWSWEGGMRGPEHAKRLAMALTEADDLRVDMKMQLRFETHMLSDYDAVETLVDQSDINFVVLNDHLPHDALIKGKRPPRMTGQALKGGRSPEAHLELMKALHANGPKVRDALTGFVERLVGKGVIVGSHDDNTAETRSWFRDIGARVSEFPETEATAVAAKDAGDPIILGAPNVVRGGSHAGKVSAADLVAQGLCDALASDYHYPAPRLAALKLARTIGLEKAWSLVSEGPAQMLGLNDRGRIETGLRADFIVLDDRDRMAASFVAGKPAYMAGDVTRRFLG